MRRASTRHVILLLAIACGQGLAIRYPNASGSSTTQDTGRLIPASSAVPDMVHVDAGEGCVVRLPTVDVWDWAPFFGKIPRIVASNVC